MVVKVYRRLEMSGQVQGSVPGKSGTSTPEDDDEPKGGSDWHGYREKPLRSFFGVRTKTDTGRRGEYPKALG